jgi:hypothetical protein
MLPVLIQGFYYYYLFSFKFFFYFTCSQYYYLFNVFYTVIMKETAPQGNVFWRVAQVAPTSTLAACGPDCVKNEGGTCQLNLSLYEWN